MWAFSTLFAALTLLPTATFGAQVVFNLDIVNTQLAPDGFTRDTVVPNGTFPGPTFKVQKGDSVVIHTHNKLTSPDMRRSTSIHWQASHGFFQARTSGMDGPSFVNQCPIAPNTTFDYVFDTANQTGSGSLFLNTDSTIITLAEWYHTVAPQVQNSFFKTGAISVQDSVLINGKGRYVNGTAVPYAVITVTQGLRYRFRVFSLSCRPYMTLSFDNHTFGANVIVSLDLMLHYGARWS
ncbi:Laccase 6 [Mycena venus]|uniref:laccase n=1 Tax=Mycena venus TaxID=2733690 RepID=A0A8H6YFP4_9AGAR|nr:Laccase 6 [Mycena venus]